MKKRFGLLSLIGAVAVLVALMGAITALADGPPVVLLDTEIVVVGGDAAGLTLLGLEASQVFTVVDEVAPAPAVLEVAAVPEASRATGIGAWATFERAVYITSMVVVLAVALTLTMLALNIALSHSRRVGRWRFAARGWLSYHNSKTPMIAATYSWRGRRD